MGGAWDEDLLAAYFLLVTFGWPLSQYETLPLRERELTKGMALKYMQANKNAMDEAKRR